MSLVGLESLNTGTFSFVLCRLMLLHSSWFTTCNMRGCSLGDIEPLVELNVIGSDKYRWFDCNYAK